MSVSTEGGARLRVFSGIQPSGNLHIGNYLGAIRRWVQRQDEFDNIFCIVDLHAITVPQDPKELRAQTRELAAIYLASGIDPAHSAVFVQSHVPAHAQSAWILNCVTPMGWLERMTQFKEKSGVNRERASVGLFDYPVLMASDILLYQAHRVPVGDDQRQHIELTRDIAVRFNRLYGETFTLPEPLIYESGARIMDLADPAKKMSKSAPEGIIGLLDPPDVIRKKVGRATTDSLREIRFDADRPGVNNLLEMYEVLTGEARPAIEARVEGKGYRELKSEVAEAVIAGLEPLQRRYAEITADPSYLERLLREGAERVAPIAERTLRTMKERMGLG
jgi:tryptophanyl-tRNA synthetase